MKDTKKRRQYMEFGEQTVRLFPELYAARKGPHGEKLMARTVTFQVTDDCNLACTYCYQGNKGKRRMSFETAKKFVDYLLDADESNHYINPTISPFIIIDFIGGEPFLEIELIEKIVNYFNEQCFIRQHPWATRHRFSICSNGVLYFNPRVQEFMYKNRGNISFSVTIDGNKELHDSCRIFHDGRPSYDLAVAAAKDWMDQGNYMGSKITIAPGNVQFLSGALKHMVELGYTEINANCVYEKGWELEHAQELYKQMKIFSDYLIENNLYRDIFCSLYQENFFQPKDPRDNQNWCFGAGTPILTTNGYKPIEEIKIGDMVYTEDGTIHPVINTMSHFANNVVKTKISGAFDIVCTDNHNFYTLPFDYIGNKGIKHYKSYTKKELKDIKHNDLLKLFTLPERNKSFDKRLAYIVGRFIGDGWKIKDKEQYFICCSKKEKEFLINKLEEANIEYSLFSNKTVEELRILNSNKELIELLKDCGYKADGKHIPKECFLWDNESLSSLIEGYIDSDGYKNKKGQYRINTVSYQLAQEIMLVLRTLGFTPTCYINNRKGKTIIEGRKVSIKNRYEIYFYDNPERSKYVHKKDDEMWTYGLKLKKDIPQIVYNLTIEGNHSYIAGGFAVSNCGGTGLMLACDPDGYLYPCLRYMESSIGNDQPPLRIGHVDRGIETLDEEKEIVKCLDCITRRSQSTDECFYCPIAEGCSWCFEEGTKVSSPNGLINIEDIKVGDIIYDMNGEEKEIIRATSHVDSDLTIIHAAGYSDVIVTKKHPFLAKKVIKRNHNIPEYSKPQWIPAGELTTSDKIGLFVPTFKEKINFNKELAYLVGRYIGDGWKTPSNRKATPFKYYICCNNKEKEKLECKFKEAGINYSVNKNKTVWEFNIHTSTKNEQTLINVLDKCGRYAIDKDIPREVWDWNIESIKSLLQGYFDADGSIYKDTQRFTSISKNLVFSIAELIRGVYHKNVSISYRKNNKTQYIEGRKVKCHDSYEGRFLLKEPKRKYYEYDEKNNIMWVNISKPTIKKLPDQIKVYNIEVKDNPTFIANGAIVHNCSAYNYQVFGTADARATFICIMHRARALGNLYYFNKIHIKENEDDRMLCYVPKEWAIPIIGEEEFSKLIEDSGGKLGMNPFDEEFRKAQKERESN